MHHLDDRVGRLEETTQKFSADLRIMSNEIMGVKADVHKINDGVARLLEREARRPDALTGKTIIATLIATGTTIGMVGTFVWWLIAASPAVGVLESRMTRIDDPEIGKVTRLEHEIRELKRWAPSITLPQSGRR